MGAEPIFMDCDDTLNMDMDKLEEFLENECDYIDGKYAGKHYGTIGDIGIYSFNANKIITTGGGGMIVSNNQELLNKVAFLGV